jgi:ferric-dicitrate binding protein FerR (iron transport regulator)
VTHAGHDGPEAPPRMPRWAKVGAMLALIAIVVLVVLLVAGGGQHGPGRHGSGAGERQQQSGADRVPSRGGHGQARSDHP